MENFCLQIFNFSDQQIIARGFIFAVNPLTTGLAEKTDRLLQPSNHKATKKIYLELQLVDENSERYLFHKIYTTS